METLREIEGAPAPVGAYSAAVKSGGFVFCAGQIALDPESGQLVDGGIRAQTERVLENLKAVLAGSGSDFNNVVMTTIFLADAADSKVVNEMYGEVVSSDAPPARQTVAVKALPLGALVEISLIAEVNS